MKENMYSKDKFASYRCVQLYALLSASADSRLRNPSIASIIFRKTTFRIELWRFNFWKTFP